MKRLFFFGIVVLALFEAANVYFIMPMPGSQRMDSLALAYFLYSSRWMFRSLFTLMIFVGMSSAWKSSKILTGISMLMAGVLVYLTHFEMAADHMFLPPTHVLMRDVTSNVISEDRLVIGIENNGDARAYPIQFLGYHHQVRDTLGGMPVMVTYCTVCRSGRAYRPLVNGKEETFRLVGMDHFNAMFEDHRTKSWWRQETGEAVAGPLKGEMLPEWPSVQTSLRTWLQMHPASLIMQPDTVFHKAYEEESDFEGGRLSGKLTVYDTASWHDKSRIAGVRIGEWYKAYDWNELKKKKLIHDVIGGQPIIILVSDNNRNLAGFERISIDQQFELKGDTLTDGNRVYNLGGHSLLADGPDLKRMVVYQEYWHSWLMFHPATTKFE